MIGRKVRRYHGLGAISNPDGSLQTFPSWCDWTPWANFLEACTPPTPEQQQASNLANVGKGMTTGNVEQLKQTWAADAASQCAQDPVGCKQLTDYQNCVAKFGSGVLCSSGVGTNFVNLGLQLGIDPTYLPVILAVGGGVLLLLIVTR